MNNTCSKVHPATSFRSDFGNVAETLLKDFFAPVDAATVSFPRYNYLTSDSYHALELALPGYDKSMVELNLKDAVLHVSSTADTDQDQRVYRLRQFSVKPFNRSFRLHKDIDQTKISASFNNGILLIKMPLIEAALPQEPQQININ